MNVLEKRQFLSVIVPCFNEEESLRETHRRLSEALARCAIKFEIIYINDGSADATLDILKELQASDQRVRVLGFSRNFGHQIAVTAGLDVAAGDAVAVIDADLQDPPELIGAMLEKWREGYEVVYGKRERREGESAFKLATAKLFYRFLNMLSDTEIPNDTGDFRLMDRRVVEAIRQMPEHDRFLRGMVSWVGFRQYALSYRRDARFAGTTKYPLMKMFRFASDGILSFSIVPLRAATWLGLLTSSLAAFGILYALVMRLLTENWVSGWTLLFIAVLFMGGTQLVMLGLMGEYVGRLYREAKGRPLYVVADRLGFDEGNALRTANVWSASR